ncbi:SPOR domain-containing protein [Glaciecola petra]|uniref:SPOR domain-containing protein n=1 Tax=Glaciecola petra TaxID=3075602 RepID=A0ABU2ZPN3_9ALTE|nr:SPOR domain-containing protein [Aestuariibacter sp. P117]MDT0594586.1 SPOR domain-containing protein [Aestuariibacter sp. P117]
MSSTLQNRLIGTIIVVALIVILLPELLDGEKRTNLQEFVNVPPAADKIEVASDSNTNIDTQAIEAEVSLPVEIVNETAVDENDEQVNNLAQNSDSDIVTVDIDSDNTSISAKGDSTNADPENENTNESIDKEADTTSNGATTVNVSQASQPEVAKIDTNTAKKSEAAWVIQLGSFRHEKNVRELIKTLKQAGYRAFSQPITTSAGELNKVFVGPELDRESLEQALPHLNELTKLKGKITAFEVSAK